MTNSTNPGQFKPNDAKTKARASEGGKASTGSFTKGSKAASDAGKKGNAHQPVEAKRLGGQHSGSNS
jgi:general stress protein YciG